MRYEIILGVLQHDKPKGEDVCYESGSRERKGGDGDAYDLAEKTDNGIRLWTHPGYASNEPRGQAMCS